MNYFEQTTTIARSPTSQLNGQLTQMTNPFAATEVAAERVWTRTTTYKGQVARGSAVAGFCGLCLLANRLSSPCCFFGSLAEYPDVGMSRMIH